MYTRSRRRLGATLFAAALALVGFLTAFRVWRQVRNCRAWNAANPDLVVDCGGAADWFVYGGVAVGLVGVGALAAALFVWGVPPWQVPARPDP